MFVPTSRFRICGTMDPGDKRRDDDSEIGANTVRLWALASADLQFRYVSL